MHVAIDLCCGRGGWARGLRAAGFKVIGYDVREFIPDGRSSALAAKGVLLERYPGIFIRADIRTLTGRLFRSDAKLIVGSPPCTEFSRWDWDMAFRRSHPDFPFCCKHLELVETVFRIAKEANVPLVLENVRGLERWIGPARAHYGPYYLWGDVPALLPDVDQRATFKGKFRSPGARAEIPFELSRHIGESFYPITPAEKQFSRFSLAEPLLSATQ